jgi:hypothetical protein
VGNHHQANGITGPLLLPLLATQIAGVLHHRDTRPCLGPAARLSSLLTRVVHEVGDGVIAGEAGACAGVPANGAAIRRGGLRGCVRHQVTPGGAAAGAAALEGVVQAKPMASLWRGGREDQAADTQMQIELEVGNRVVLWLGACLAAWWSAINSIGGG